MVLNISQPGPARAAAQKVRVPALQSLPGGCAVYVICYIILCSAFVVALFGTPKDENQPTVSNGYIPYPGLKAFQESAPEFFFGRELLIDDLL